MSLSFSFPRALNVYTRYFAMERLAEWVIPCVSGYRMCSRPAAEVEGTDVFASTLHSLFDLDSAYNSNLDFTKTGAELSWAGDTRSVKSLESCACLQSSQLR